MLIQTLVDLVKKNLKLYYKIQFELLGYVAFCFAVLVSQITLVLKKKQFEKVQAAELNF
jgi:hypothetical protein